MVRLDGGLRFRLDDDGVGGSDGGGSGRERLPVAEVPSDARDEVAAGGVRLQPGAGDVSYRFERLPEVAVRDARIIPLT